MLEHLGRRAGGDGGLVDSTMVNTQHSLVEGLGRGSGRRIAEGDVGQCFRSSLGNRWDVRRGRCCSNAGRRLSFDSRMDRCGCICAGLALTGSRPGGRSPCRWLRALHRGNDDLGSVDRSRGIAGFLGTVRFGGGGKRLAFLGPDLERNHRGSRMWICWRLNRKGRVTGILGETALAEPIHDLLSLSGRSAGSHIVNVVGADGRGGESSLCRRAWLLVESSVDIRGLRCFLRGRCLGLSHKVRFRSIDRPSDGAMLALVAGST